MTSNQFACIARAVVRATLVEHVPAMIRAMVARANGLHYLVVRGEDGQFERIPTDITGEQLDALLASGRVVEVRQLDPCPQAAALLDWAMGRPPAPPGAITLVQKPH